jgi:hypothetical protein
MKQRASVEETVGCLVTVWITWSLLLATAVVVMLVLRLFA